MHAFVLQQAAAFQLWFFTRLPSFKQTALRVLLIVWEAVLPDLMIYALKAWVKGWRIPKAWEWLWLIL